MVMAHLGAPFASIVDEFQALRCMLAGHAELPVDAWGQLSGSVYEQFFRFHADRAAVASLCRPHETAREKLEPARATVGGAAAAAAAAACPICGELHSGAGDEGLCYAKAAWRAPLELAKHATRLLAAQPGAEGTIAVSVCGDLQDGLRRAVASLGMKAPPRLPAPVWEKFLPGDLVSSLPPPSAPPSPAPLGVPIAARAGGSCHSHERPAGRDTEGSARSAAAGRGFATAPACCGGPFSAVRRLAVWVLVLAGLPAAQPCVFAAGSEAVAHVLPQFARVSQAAVLVSSIPPPALAPLVQPAAAGVLPGLTLAPATSGWLPACARPSAANGRVGPRSCATTTRLFWRAGAGAVRPVSLPIGTCLVAVAAMLSVPSRALVAGVRPALAAGASIVSRVLAVLLCSALLLIPLLCLVRRDRMRARACCALGCMTVGSVLIVLALTAAWPLSEEGGRSLPVESRAGARALNEGTARYVSGHAPRVLLCAKDLWRVAECRRAALRQRREWARLMRAAKGNTADRVEVIHWNTRQLDAGCASVTGREKLDWLTSELGARRPTVVFLSEVLGDLSAFRVLRKRLRHISYSAVFLPGARDGRKDGIVCAVATEQAGLVKWHAVAERALGVTVQHRGEADERAYAYVHGVTASSDSQRPSTRFRVQLRAAVRWVRDRGGGLLLGDMNYVPCAEWRVRRAPLNPGDLALRRTVGWTCACCARASDAGVDDVIVLGGDGGVLEGDEGWTRYATHNGEWGSPTSRIDLSLVLGDNTGGRSEAMSDWQSEAMLLPEAGDGSARALSDHLVQCLSCPLVLPAGSRQARRLAPNLGRRGDGPERSEMLTAELAAGGKIWRDMCEGMAWARQRCTPCADAVVGAVMRASDGIDKILSRKAELRRAGSGRRVKVPVSPKSALFLWWARLKEVSALRRRGVSPEAASGAAVLHPAARLRKYVSAGPDGWSPLVRKCRRELKIAQRRLDRPAQEETRRLVALADKWVALPEGATAEKDALAFKMARKRRAGCNMTHVRVGDSKGGRRVSTLRAEAAGIMRDIGQRTVAGYDDGAVPAACEAWHQKFIGQWPELAGSDGGVFVLRKEVTFRVFRDVVRSMPPKAVGISGIAIAQLRRASTTLLRAAYEAVMDDADGQDVSERWHVIMYVLLEKKAPNDPELVGDRREIALTEHDVKALLQCVRRVCYARVVGRISKHNLGWVPGYGCNDVALGSAWATQQASVLSQSIWLLYIDMAQFFPRIHRECLKIGELAHGLPDEVVRLAARVYGAHVDDPNVAKCVYDSSGGLSESFSNGCGALMGCPLSTDRARIFLNSIVVAIDSTVRGFKLWGADGARVAGEWRRVAQLMAADDWLGIFDDAGELRKAWALWVAWEPMVGAKLGIKAADKTVLTGALRRDGRVFTVPDPGLYTTDGRKVPVRPPSYAYKHVGKWRRGDGCDRTARSKFVQAIKGAISRVRAMHCSATRRQLMVVSSALIGGLAECYLQDTYLTFDECDALEAAWRNVINRKLKRARDTPRAELYADRWEAGRTRRHLYSHWMIACYTAVGNAMADAHDVEHRALTRSGVALAFHRWGCRTDPSTWDFSHLKGSLQLALKRPKERLLGDAWMLATILLREQDTEERATADGLLVNWRWVSSPSDGDPLSGAAAHFSSAPGALIFETGRVEVAPALLHAGYVCAEHFACRVFGGGTRWLSFDEAARSHKALSDTAEAREQWGVTVAKLGELGGVAASVKPEGPSEVWAAAGRRASPFDCSAGVRRGDVHLAATHRLGQLLKAAQGAGRSAPLGGYAAHVDAWRAGLASADAAGWRALLDDAIACAAPQQREWVHGAPSRADHASGAHVVYDLGGEEGRDGGQATWLARTDVGEDGCLLGWEERAQDMLVVFGIDDSGYATEGGVRICEDELYRLPPALRLFAMARYRLGADVEVVDRPPDVKSNSTHVNLQAAENSFRDAVAMQCKYDLTHAATLDATKVDKEGATGPYVVVARAAVLHDGTVVAGTLREEDVFLDEHRTTYLGEKAACDDVLAQLPDGCRVAFWLDSTSPYQALKAFRRSPARRKKVVHAAGRHAATSALLERQELVCLHWQMSHVGEPVNELADVEADRAAEGEIPLAAQEPIYPFCSALFPRTVRSPRAWAAECADRHVHRRLRAFTEHSIFAGADDVRPLWRGSDDATVIPAVRAERCFFSDKGQHHTPAQSARMRELTCPWGCGCPCTWAHFALECKGAEMSLRRGDLHGHVLHLKYLCEPVVPHPEVGDAAKLLGCALGRGAARMDGAAETVFSPSQLLNLRRVVCGHVSGFSTDGVESGRELREALALVADSAECMMEAAHEACNLRHGDELRSRELACRVFLRYVRKLRARVRDAGPGKAGRLREAYHLAVRVEGFAPGVGQRAYATQVLAAGVAASVNCADFGRVCRPAPRILWWILWRLLLWRLRVWDRLCVVDVRHRTGDEEAHWSAFAVRAGVAPGGWGGVHGVAGRVETRRQIVMRTRLAGRRAARPPLSAARLRKLRSGRAAAEAKADAVRAHDAQWLNWSNGLGVTGGAIDDIEGHLYVDLGEGRARKGAKRRKREADNRGVRDGRLPDSRQAWSVDSVLDVRRRDCKGFAIDALLRWASPDAGTPWRDDWVPLNGYWMPSKELRAEAWSMWRERFAAPAPPPAAAGQEESRWNTREPHHLRPRGGLGSARPRAPAVVPRGTVYPRMERDLDAQEEAELRRLDDGSRLKRPGSGLSDNGSGSDGEEGGEAEVAEEGGEEEEGDLEVLLRRRSERLAQDELTRLRVKAEAARFYDIGIRVNPALAVHAARGRATQAQAGGGPGSSSGSPGAGAAGTRLSGDGGDGESEDESANALTHLISAGGAVLPDDHDMLTSEARQLLLQHLRWIRAYCISNGMESVDWVEVVDLLVAEGEWELAGGASGLWNLCRGIEAQGADIRWSLTTHQMRFF